MTTIQNIVAQLDLSPAQGAEPFSLRVGPVGITVFCPGALRSELVAYYADALTPEPGEIVVHLLPDQMLTPEPEWNDWQREAGKSGRKDAVCDLPDGRLIKKVRSGVTFVQNADWAIAMGPLAENSSTVINFINTQILSHCLRDGWQLCHAAAVTDGAGTLAISGLSGGGKSTSILRMLDFDSTRFVSNDRLLVKAGHPPQVLGIPKHPRINPGTILGNPRLSGMLSDEERAQVLALPADALWDLEQKHDLVIPDIYGPNRIQYDAPLTDFWVLNWSRDSDAPTDVAEVDLTRRPDLLGAIVKSPGSFYQHPDGRFEPNGAMPVPEPYLSALRGVRVCEVSGRVDFDALAQFGRQIFDG